MSSRAFIAALAVLSLAAPGSGAPLSADFREELSLPSFRPEARVLESLAEPVAGAPDLDLADEISNPEPYEGFVTVDFDATGLITLTNDTSEGSRNYELAVFTISNIAFDAGEVIGGVTVLTNDLIEVGPLSGPFVLSTASTADSVTITYTGQPQPDDFKLAIGGSATFQIVYVPEPAGGLLLMLGIIGVARAAGRPR